MKYLIRSVKYFVRLAIILCLIIFVSVKAGFIEGDLSRMFVNGYDSLWQIALLLAVFSAIYPRLGYSSRNLHLNGSDEELLPVIREVMEDRGYKIGKQEGDTLSFVKRAPLSRAFKLWEDRVTFTRILGGYSIEGITKDITRLCSALESKVSMPDEDA